MIFKKDVHSCRSFFLRVLMYLKKYKKILHFFSKGIFKSLLYNSFIMFFHTQPQVKKQKNMYFKGSIFFLILTLLSLFWPLFLDASAEAFFLFHFLYPISFIFIDIAFLNLLLRVKTNNTFVSIVCVTLFLIGLFLLPVLSIWTYEIFIHGFKMSF